MKLFAQLGAATALSIAAGAGMGPVKLASAEDFASDCVIHTAIGELLVSRHDCDMEEAHSLKLRTAPPEREQATSQHNRAAHRLSKA